MKKIGIVLLIISLLAITTGTILLLFSPKKEKTTLTEKASEKGICDYEICNIENTLTEAKIYKNYQFASIKLSASNQIVKFTCTITNLENKQVPSRKITLTFLSNTKSELEKVTVTIPELKATESYVLEELLQNEKTIEAFYIEIS